MEKVFEYIKLGVFLLTLTITIIQNVILIIKKVKNKKWTELRTYLEKKILPLMEQAEVTFEDPCEREDWVIKKLGENLHIDFYKYKKVLALVLDIIQTICKQTHNGVNSQKIVNVVKKEDNNNANTTLY